MLAVLESQLKSRLKDEMKDDDRSYVVKVSRGSLSSLPRPTGVVMLVRGPEQTLPLRVTKFLAVSSRP
jgi:hypothetical protein